MKTLGRYHLQEKLGQGGMGIVYRAFDTLLERVVAVKLISASIDENPELRDRFFREARAAGQLSHPNVITVYDLGEHEGQPYLAMEYLDGEDLQSRMARPEPMSLRRRVDVACEICAGLEYAHARGIVHRDIKPANVFLPTGGGVKILDFGLARLMTSELTRSHVMMGTVNYMAPEQIRGERADHRADIFSTGVLLYELLSGRKAFDGDSFASLMFQILEHEPTALREIDPGLPADLVTVVERAMAKLREERYQQISDVAKDLALVRQQLTFPESPATGRVAPAAWRTGPVASASDDETRLISSPAPGTLPAPVLPARVGSDVPTVLAAARDAIAPPAVAAPRPRRLLPLAAAVLIGAGLAGAWWWSASGSRPDARSAANVATVTTTPAPPSAAPPSLPSAAPSSASAPNPATASPAVPAASGAAPSGAAPSGAVSSGAATPPVAEAPAAASTGAQDQALQDARSAASQARAAARAARAQTLASRPYGQAATVEGEAARLRSAGRTSEAAAKYYEASGLFRGAQAAAETEAAARLAKASSAAGSPLPPASPREAAPSPSSGGRAPVTEPAAPPAARTETAPAASPAITAPPPPAPPPAPAPAPGATSPAAPAAGRETAAHETVPAPKPEAAAAVAALLQEYRSALESRSLAALRRIWPTLGGAQLAAIRDEFDHATRISVELVDPRIGVTGQTATVTFVRRYALVTVDGQRLQTDSRTTMELRRAGDTWVIDAMRFQPVR